MPEQAATAVTKRGQPPPQRSSGDPHLVALPRRGWAWPTLRIQPWRVVVGALVLASELVARAGHTSASYDVDALAVATYLSLQRLTRPRSRRLTGELPTPARERR